MKKTRDIPSRDDVRQEQLIASILDEKAEIDRKMEKLADRIYCLSAKELPSLDRNMLSVQFAIMRAYSEILWATANWEKVRIRRRNGEYLNRGAMNMMSYLMGSWGVVDQRVNPDMAPDKCRNCRKCKKCNKGKKSSKTDKSNKVAKNGEGSCHE